jgi:hypothetical protein
VFVKYIFYTSALGVNVESLNMFLTNKCNKTKHVIILIPTFYCAGCISVVAPSFTDVFLY